MQDRLKASFIKYKCDYDIDTMTDKSYEVFKIIENLGLFPFYITRGSPYNAELIEIDKDVIRLSFIKNRDKQFSELGTRLSLSYSTNGIFDRRDNTGDITICLGSNVKFADNVINFDICNDFDELNILELVNSFKRIIDIFNPNLAYLLSSSNINNTNTKKRDEKTKMPRTVQWINYWDNEIVEKIGIKNIEDAGFYKVEKLENGYLLILQEKPINNECESEIANQMNVIKYLSKFW